MEPPDSVAAQERRCAIWRVAAARAGCDDRKDADATLRELERTELYVAKFKQRGSVEC